MNTILVPTDFSEAAKRAANYALHFADQVHAKKILLYNAYQQPVATDAGLAPIELIDFEELKTISNNALENFKNQLAVHSNDITIEVISQYATLADGLQALSEEQPIDAIVMGVTGGGKIEETLMGSNAVNVAKNADIPVIVVPPETTFSDIKNVMLACDFKDVADTTPVAEIKKILDETKAKFFVLNIDHENKNFTPDTPFESLQLNEMFYTYQPEYHFVDSENFTEGVNSFAEDKGINLIITIPKKHNFFEGLFKRSHTKQLAFHSHVPLMVIHD